MTPNDTKPRSKAPTLPDRFTNHGASLGSTDHSGKPTVRLTIVGDIMAGDSAICVGWGMASRWSADRFGMVIQNTGMLFRDADIVLGNLESPLTPNGRGKTRWHRDQMRAAPEVARSLKHIGFSVVGTANNHAVQHGVEGYVDTTKALEAAGLVALGRRGTAPWVSRPEILMRHGVSVGFLAYCWRPRQYGPEEPPFAEGNLTEAVSDIKRLSQQCDMIVVSLHWGDEFFDQPSEEQIAAARQLVDAGARIVVGHHPHVLRPIERYGDGVIAYSLGNFCSDMVWLPEARVGAVLTCVCTKDALVSVETDTVETSRDFTVTRSASQIPPRIGKALSGREYADAVEKSLSRQRLLAYQYAVRNVYRFSWDVLAELVTRTLRHKVHSMLRRLLR